MFRLYREFEIFQTLFVLKVTGSRSKLPPRSNHDVAQLDHGRNMCANFELLPVYGHRDAAWTKWQALMAVG